MPAMLLAMLGERSTRVSSLQWMDRCVAERASSRARGAAPGRGGVGRGTPPGGRAIVPGRITSA